MEFVSRLASILSWLVPILFVGSILWILYGAKIRFQADKHRVIGRRALEVFRQRLNSECGLLGGRTSSEYANTLDDSRDLLAFLDDKARHLTELRSARRLWKLASEELSGWINIAYEAQVATENLNNAAISYRMSAPEDQQENHYQQHHNTSCSSTKS